QQLAPVLISAYIPLWYIEGDAVVSETALSESGRGRQPSFTMIMKAQLCERGIYNYNKALFGSLKHMSPDAYVLGYHLVGQSKILTDQFFWKRVLKQVSKHPLSFSGFNEHIKKERNMNKVEFYKHCLTVQKEQYRIDSTSKFTQKETISPSKGKEDINYKHPHLSTNSSIIAVKNSLSHRPQFVSIDSLGNETKLHEPGRYYNETLSVKNNLICWAEQSMDLRWSHRSYSEIKILNTETNIIKHLTQKSRYFAPALSNDTTKVAAVEVNDLYEKRLIIINPGSGEVISQKPIPNNAMMQHPVWSEDDKKIYGIIVGEDYKQIISYDIFSGEFDEVSSKTVVDIKHPVEKNNFLYFTAAFNQTDNIYRFNLSNHEMEQITHVKYGADFAEINTNGDELYFSNYTASGFELAKINLKERTFTPFQFKYKVAFPLADALSTQSGNTFETSQIPTNIYLSKKYSKLTHLFNIHSWSPFIPDVSTETLNPGISFQSQNQLSTMTSVVGIAYDPNLIMPRLYAQLQYTGLYPTFDLTLSKNLGKSNVVVDNVRGNGYIINQINLGASLPLSYSQDNNTIFLQARTSISRSLWEIYPEDLEKDVFQIATHEFHSQILAQKTQMKSPRDLYPKWGQLLYLKYSQLLPDDPIFDHTLSATTLLYFPGLYPHHSFRILSGYELNGKDEFFNSQIAYSRGYYLPNRDQLFASRFDYSLPLIYPDLNLGLIAYIKRIQMNAFFDITFGQKHDVWNDYQSVGLDIIVDMHILRFLAPIQLGLRNVYNFNEGKMMYYPIFQINFNDIY
ncbi:MAG: hypothetical protein JEZ03_13105, partial [Bacteroidales bacterium]|nr:hypothetical protein [Bacteroidales bacterium]